MIARGSYPHAASRIIGRTDNAMTKIALNAEVEKRIRPRRGGEV
jgi:hypothetical protein